MEEISMEQIDDDEKGVKRVKEGVSLSDIIPNKREVSQKNIDDFVEKKKGK